MSYIFNIFVRYIFYNLGKKAGYWCDYKSHDRKNVFFLLSLCYEAEPWEGCDADLAVVLQWWNFSVLCITVF